VCHGTLDPAAACLTSNPGIAVMKQEFINNRVYHVNYITTGHIVLKKELFSTIYTIIDASSRYIDKRSGLLSSKAAERLIKAESG